jgi:lysophospholipid acyltransferase (LPLAT)-like uncharacterized protein
LSDRKGAFAAFAGTLFVKLLHATLRVRHAGIEHIDGTPQFILAFWHECVLMCLHSRWRRPTKAIISRSKDGSIMAAAVERYGAESARGSSSRGGEVVLRRRVVKEGVAFIARASGLPIVPFYFTAERKKRLRSWDAHIFPMPFSRALFLYGPPIVVPRDGDAEQWRLAIESAMNALAEEAERDFDRLWKAAPRSAPPLPSHGAASAAHSEREKR